MDKNLGQRLYRQVWKHAGGRPWTFILRDSSKKHPIAWIVGSLIIGILLGHIFWSTSKEEEDKYDALL